MIPSFRAYDKNTGTLHYTDDSHMFEWFSSGWHLIALDELGPRIICGQVEGGRDDGVLMMSTGLVDKTEHQIYVGDCLRWEDWRQELTELSDVYVVSWLDEAAKVVINCYRDGRLLKPMDADFRDSREFDLVGDIYTSPEILRPAA